jgi:hypothetical protein
MSKYNATNLAFNQDILSLSKPAAGGFKHHRLQIIVYDLSTRTMNGGSKVVTIASRCFRLMLRAYRRVSFIVVPTGAAFLSALLRDLREALSTELEQANRDSFSG